MASVIVNNQAGSLQNTIVMGRLIVFAFLAIGATVSLAAIPAARKPVAQPNAELTAAANTAVQRGFHAELPPHISTLLGLTHEETCAVRQGVLRSNGKIQGIDVSEKNHNDIVIFIADETSRDQTFYLTSRSGALRRLLTVKQGIGYVVKPTKTDVEAFQKEKKMWKERLTAVPAPAK